MSPIESGVFPVAPFSLRVARQAVVAEAGLHPEYGSPREKSSMKVNSP